MSNFWGLFLFEKRCLKNKLKTGFYFVFLYYEKVLFFDWHDSPNFNCWLVMISGSFCIYGRAYLLLLNVIFCTKSMDFYKCDSMCLGFSSFISACMFKD